MSDKKKEIFVGTLTAPYDAEKYLTFLRELLSNMEQIAPDKNMSPYNTFSVAVDHYNHIGNYVGQDNNKVAVFSICLKDYRNIENARSMQRGFVKSLLENSDCAGALVAFHTKDKPEKWRLSLVRMDYEFSKGKLSAKLTPAKRYSYLVGKGEPCHTAQERLYPIFVNDNLNPGLDELEDAFSVEAVTKDFFEQYREKYLDLKDYLERNPQFIAEAQSRGFDSEQFAKKLLGQIVFLYFIQKKGWLGVNAFPPDLTKRDYNNAFYCRGYGAKPKELLPFAYKPTQDDKFARDSKAIRSLSDENQTFLSKFVKGDKWGNGPRDFMRRLFEDCVKSGKNYFDDYLEPLFYDGLNQSRGENAFFPPLHCRIPFLNGGLFEEMEGYDWRNNHFSIPNGLFSNADTKGWEADGILDVFDRYNFTMAEDEPMEREVAIDPEMLGKVFENLLDIKDRKSKGAFYTPREIVHYMCQESLINYLAGRTGIPSDDIRKFVLYGEYFRDEDVKKTLFVKGQNGAKGHYEFDRNKPLEIPETILSYKKGVNRLLEIDELLANVKVVDLAVGSGAFPLGMLNEIVRARDTITSYMTIEMNSAQRLMCRSDRDLYRLKRDAIKNSIFACDIEPSAADITKLRLWLSLVIDDVIQEQDDDILGYSTKPRELPNLDCNVICGNSLMDSFRGLPLITESSALNNLSVNSQTSMYDPHVARMINILIQYQSQLYDEKDRDAKDSLKRQIQDIYDEIIFAQIGDSGDSADEYRQSSVLASRPFVLWQLYFPKVFRDNGGFDIAIGNPPYGAKISPSDKKQYQSAYHCTKTIKGKQKGSTDTFALFIERGLALLRSVNATLAFIVPMSVTSSDAMTALHNIMESQCAEIRVSSYSNRPKQIFDAACVRTSIIICRKTGTPIERLYTTKLVRRSETNTIADIIKSLSFVDSLSFKRSGRYPKIGSLAEYEVLKDMFSCGKTLMNYYQMDSSCNIYYRSAGGRYFNVITPYRTGSSQEVPYPVLPDFLMPIGAILSTSLFWFYQQVYTDGLHIKQSEIAGVPMPDLYSAEPQALAELSDIYQKYLDEIERNAITHESTAYTVGRFKEYKIGKSKALIDELDDCVAGLYGMTKQQAEFVKNYELSVRISE